MDKLLVGKPPVQLGYFDLKCPEMMFIQDMPVVMPGKGLRLPDNLKFLEPFFEVVQYSVKHDYVYVSCKSMFVTKESRGRPGWHLDGFGTNDINYIWSDDFPTEFYIGDIELTNDPIISRLEMDELISEENITIYPNKKLLMMDSSVIHRVSTDNRIGFRTFIKITVSTNQFRLFGNAHNYLFDYDWLMVPRSLDRNLPQTNG